MTLELRTDARAVYVSGIVELHKEFYVDQWGFGDVFVERITEHVSSFIARFDAQKDLMLTAHQGSTLVSSLIMDVSGDASKGAYLRWFIVSERARGAGLGGYMMQFAMDWCAQKKYNYCTLSTYSGLKAARVLYDRYGFKLVSERSDDPWDAGVGEQMFEWRAHPKDSDAA